MAVQVVEQRVPLPMLFTKVETALMAAEAVAAVEQTYQQDMEEATAVTVAPMGAVAAVVNPVNLQYVVMAVLEAPTAEVAVVLVTMGQDMIVTPVQAVSMVVMVEQADGRALMGLIH